MNWDSYFMEIARVTAQKSKDPSTKVGAIIVDPYRRVVSAGFNGFARGVEDSQKRLTNRQVKLELTLHAELNALLYAQRNLTGCSIYVWPFEPCAACASAIAQSGIARVITPRPDPELFARWEESILLAREIFSEARIKLIAWESEDDERRDTRPNLELSAPSFAEHPSHERGASRDSTFDVGPLWASGLD